MQGGGTDKQRGRSTLKRMGEIYATDLRKATDQCDVDSSKRWTVDRRTSSSNGFGITSATLSSNIALPEIAER
jgi:hypothetical protein